jgi:hypothetical protein
MSIELHLSELSAYVNRFNNTVIESGIAMVGAIVITLNHKQIRNNNQ